jgi:hypothetical protein
VALGETKSKKPSIDFLKHCPRLGYAYIEGHAKGFESIASLNELNELRLRTSPLRTLETLHGHASIERLEILYASTRDLSPLASMPLLRRAWLSRIRGLDSDDLAGLAGKAFEMLALNDQPHVTDLSPLGSPETWQLSLDNLSSLESLEPLTTWPYLERLGLYKCPPADGRYGLLANCPRLRQLAIHAPKMAATELDALMANFRGDSLSGDQLIGDPPPERLFVQRSDL